MYNCMFYIWDNPTLFIMVIAKELWTDSVFAAANLEAWEVGQLMGGN